MSKIKGIDPQEKHMSTAVRGKVAKEKKQPMKQKVSWEAVPGVLKRTLEDNGCEASAVKGIVSQMREQHIRPELQGPQELAVLVHVDSKRVVVNFGPADCPTFWEFEKNGQMVDGEPSGGVFQVLL